MIACCVLQYPKKFLLAIRGIFHPGKVQPSCDLFMSDGASLHLTPRGQWILKLTRGSKDSNKFRPTESSYKGGHDIEVYSCFDLGRLNAWNRATYYSSWLNPPPAFPGSWEGPVGPTRGRRGRTGRTGRSRIRLPSRWTPVAAFWTTGTDTQPLRRPKTRKCS